MLTMTEPEDMEVDYDDPMQNTYTHSFHSPFQSSQSIFTKDRLKTSFANNVTDLFGKIQLNEQKKEEQKQEKKEEEKEEQSTKSMIPYPSPSSPVSPLSNSQIYAYNSSPAIIQSPHEQQPNDDTSLQQQQQQVDITHSIPSEDKPYIVLHHSHDYLNHSHGKIHYLSGLVKIAFMACIVVLVIYLAAIFVKSLKHDVKSKIVEYETDSVQEMAYCHQQYEMNECDPITQLPALKELCRDWERCMYRPASVSHTKAMAETMGDIANGFVETITLRTLLAGVAMTWSFFYFWSSRT